MTNAWLAADPCPAAANTGGLTQPWATVAAAIIAVIGALIAYAGVTKTTRASRNESRRADKVAALVEAFASVNNLRAIAHRMLAQLKRSPTEFLAQKPWFSDQVDDTYNFSVSKLDLYGFRDAADKMSEFKTTLINGAVAMEDDVAARVDEANLWRVYGSACTAIQHALHSLK